MSKSTAFDVRIDSDPIIVGLGGLRLFGVNRYGAAPGASRCSNCKRRERRVCLRR